MLFYTSSHFITIKPLIMKKSILLLAGLFIFFTGVHGQVIKRASNSEFSISLPSNYPQYLPLLPPGRSETLCRSWVFFEFGDGHFTSRLPAVHRYNHSIVPYKTLATVAILYDTTPRPPRGDFFAREISSIPADD